MRKVLIITYYWPPSGGAGVQRWLKFVKYLRNYNWEPLVYIPDNPEYPLLDQTLVKDVPSDISIIRRPIKEPYNIYKKFTGRKKGESVGGSFASEKNTPKFNEKIALWIRSNFFIPDARKLWIKPSVKFLSSYLKKHPVDMIVSTGPPHSLHLIGLNLKTKTKVPWIADFRDPWTNIDFFDELLLTKRAFKKHHKLEEKVLLNADLVVAVSNHMKREFANLGAKNVQVITNGFDEDDIIQKDFSLDKSFSIAHIGTFMKNRNSDLLWEVLRDLTVENENFGKDLVIKLIGNVDFSILNSLKENDLTRHVQNYGYLTHEEVVKQQYSSQVLLLPINQSENAKGVVTGKLFEYIVSTRPILVIGPEDGDAAEIVKKTNTGEVVGFNDAEKLKNTILTYYNLYRNNKLQIVPKDIDCYSRKRLTQDLCKLLDDVLEDKVNEK